MPVLKSGLPSRELTRSEIEAISKSATTAYLMDTFAVCRILGRIWLLCNKDDRAIAQPIIREGFWEAWITCWFHNNVKPEFAVMDIGANIGYYTLMCAEIGCKVLAVEPQEINCTLLAGSVILNNYKNVTILNSAISDEFKEALFCVDANNNGGSHITGQQSNSSYPVKCIPLDSISERFDVIKIDAEGSEVEIWKGGQLYFKKNPDVIVVMEWAPRRYINAEELAGDILSKCTVAIIDYAGKEISITSVAQMLPYADEVMLVLRFRK